MGIHRRGCKTTIKKGTLQSNTEFWTSEMIKNDQDSRRNVCRLDLRRPCGSWSIRRYSLASGQPSLMSKDCVQPLINRPELFNSAVDLNVTWHLKTPTTPPSWAVVWWEELLYLLGCLQMVLEDFALHTRLMTNSVCQRGVCTQSCVCTVTTRELWISNTMNYSFVRVF